MGGAQGDSQSLPLVYSVKQQFELSFIYANCRRFVLCNIDMQIE